jgi:Fic family protein
MATEAISASRQIHTLLQKDYRRCAEAGRSAGTLLKLLDVLGREPMITVKNAAVRLGVSQVAATRALIRLEQMKIVKEQTGGDYARVFAYQSYLKIIAEDTSPFPNDR